MLIADDNNNADADADETYNFDADENNNSDADCWWQHHINVHLVGEASWWVLWDPASRMLEGIQMIMMIILMMI